MWAALVPSVALADVYTYSIDRFVSYTQTSNSQPTTPETWVLLAFLGTGVENELLSAAVSFNAPPIVSHALDLSSDPTHTYAYFSSAYYPDEASSLLNFPGTTYTFTVDRGAGPETADMFLAEDLYSLEVPYLTGGTFDSMQHLDATQPFNGTINGFTMAAGTTDGLTYLAVVEDGAPGSIWTAVLAPGETAFQIPAGLLTPDRNYSIGVSYIDHLLIENAGFGTASSQAGFTRGTGAYFSTFAPMACALVSQQPAPVSTCPSGTANFSVTTSGTGPFTYQWQWQPAGPGTAWAALSDGINTDNQGTPAFDVSGATTPTVGVRSIWGLGGNIRCFVTDTCGSATSDEATLSICIGDADCDQDTDSDDIVAFFTAWDQGEPGGDADADGDTDSDDIIAFFAAWDSGC